MTTTVERTYPLSPRELVESMLGDEYQAARSAKLGGTAPPTVTRSGDTATVRFPRKLPMDDLPSALRSLAGSGEVTQVEEWTSIADDRCEARWHTESAMPGKVEGTFEVVPAGDGATYRVTATATIKVPLIGGKIGKEVEGHVRKLIEAEMDFAETWIESR
jgi:hypothetical protein